MAYAIRLLRLTHAPERTVGLVWKGKNVENCGNVSSENEKYKLENETDRKKTSI